MAEHPVNSAIEGQNAEQNPNSVEATIKSEVQGGTESTCHNLNNNAESSIATPEVVREESLEYADELMERGSKADKESDYTEATECFSRALEIRVVHFGELAPECIDAYYRYGRALLYKAQEEADPLGAVPKKEQHQRDLDKDESVRSTATTESSAASVRTDVDEGGSSKDQRKEKSPDSETAAEGKDEENDEESDGEDLADGDEDESDLDLAWKMLDVARAITEKHSGDTMQKVDILSALAEVALEREDFETSLSDYVKALSILERLVESDSRHLAYLNFRICLCLEVGSKPLEAIPYCQKALCICKTRMHRLTNEAKSLSGSTASASESGSDQTLDSLPDREAEIESLTGLSVDLEKKLEDLQQLAVNPKSSLADMLGMLSAKVRGAEKATAAVGMSSSQIGISNSNGGFDSPTVSTAHTNGNAGVTHLGVVGRGVKRVLTNSDAAESNTMKRSSTEPSNDGDRNAS